MKTVLVTGSSGFIGSRLVLYLRKKNIEVLEFDIPEYDVTRPESFDLSDDRKISHVFHLAGKTYVPESWKDPYEFYKVNVLGTVNVLEFCRQTNARV